MKKAFSLIEVIFVLVILGIVASISSQIIIQVYENYITQRAVYNMSTKTELAINQIVNHLTYSVVDSAIAKNKNDSSDYKLLTQINLMTDTNLTILEWIGYDNDSFSAGSTPYWSGIANYTDTNRTNPIIETPGSNLNNVDTIIQNLSSGQVQLIPGFDKPAIIFQPRTGKGDDINGECMGLIPPPTGNTNCIYPVSELNATNFNFTPKILPIKTIITERYQLAWSAYALVPTLKSNGLYDLNLHFNYQPWENNETYNNNATTKTLITNVSVFKFTQSGGIIQLKLCTTENIGADYNISTCKEKAIIR